MNVADLPEFIYGMKPAYASSGLKRTYNKQMEVVRFVRTESEHTDHVYYEADEVYRYKDDGSIRIGKPKAKTISPSFLPHVNDGPTTKSPVYGVDYTLFYDKDIAYVSKVQSIEDLKRTYTSELRRLQKLFDDNVPRVDAHSAAVQAIREEHPEKFI